MWASSYLLHPLALILQVIAIVHFIKRRPNTYWLFIIFFGGGIGAGVYIVAEVLPDATLLRDSLQVFARRRRMREVEAAIIDNPSPANYEELGGLYLDDHQFAKARMCFDKAISPRSDLADPFYRRALAAIEMADFEAALPDLERVVSRDPRYDSYRAAGWLGHVYGKIGNAKKAEEMFQVATATSTLSETYYNFACFLAGHQRNDEARMWAERILAKEPTMPRYLRRRERPWLRKAAALIKRLPK